MKIKTAPAILAWLMRRVGFDGWTSFWDTIYILPGFENDARLIRHEQCHLNQIERDGRIMFSIRYLWWLMKYGYWLNPYEVEARRFSDGVHHA